MFTSFVNLLFIITILQNSEPQVCSLKNMTVTNGIYADRIVVEWGKTENASYTVMRSQKKTGEFAIVSQTSDTRFEDSTVEIGVKYWYRVIPSQVIIPDSTVFITEQEYQSFPDTGYVDPEINKKETVRTAANETAAGKTGNEKSAEPPVSYSGYTSIETYTGVKFDDLMKLKKEKLKAPSDAEGRKKQKAALDYIQPYYVHPVKLTLFLTMSKPYFDKGDLKILTDCDAFEISEDMRNVVFYNQKNRCTVDFYSKIIRKVISRTGDRDLVGLLLRNAELYCVPNGKKFIVDKNGVTRLVNTFEAVGLSTRYLKNDVEWRSRTIILSTSKPELTEKLKNVSRDE